MADNDKILFKDLFDLADIEKGLTNLEKRISDTKKSIKTDAGGVGGNLSNTTVGSGTDYQKLVNEIKKAQTTLESFIKTQKQEKEVNEQLLETKKKQIEIQAQLALSKREDAQALKSRIGELQAEKMATEGGTKSLVEMKQELRALTSISLRGKKPEEIKEIQTQIGVLRNDIKDLNQQMKLMDKGEILGGWIKIGQGVVGAFGAATAALNLFGSENKTVQEIERKSMALIQLMMGLEQARQLLIDQGGIKNLKTLWATTQAHLLETLTIKAKTVATIGSTVATEAGAKATQKLTVIQKAWNAAIAANPIGALVVVLFSLVLAIAAVSAAIKEQTAAQMVNKKVMDEYNKICIEPLTTLQKLETAVRNTALGTKEHTAALVEYNKNAKANNLTQIDLNKTYNETLIILGKNRLQLIENLKAKAQEIAYTNLLSKAIELENKFKSGDYKFFRKGELMDEIVMVNMQLKEMEKNMYKINTDKIDTGEIFISKDPTKELNREFKIIDGTIRDVKGSTDKLGDSNKTVTKTTKEYKKSVDELTQSLKEGINADDEKQKRLDIRIKQEKELTDVLKDQEKEATARYEKEAVRRMLQEPKSGGDKTFGDMDLEGQLDVIVNGKYTKASQEMGDAIVEMMQRIADEKMKAAEADYARETSEVEAHDAKLQRLDDELKKEQEKAARGIANNASLIKNQIATEKALQDLDKQKQAVARKEMEKAFEAKKKADKAATRIDYFKELGSIATTAASLGFPYGIIYGVLMAGLATVNFSKRMQAINAETLKFAAGGRGIVRGRRHSEGGENVAGVGEVEDGEAFSVFSRDATKRNKKEIFDFTDAVNSGRLNEQLNKWALYKNLNIPMIITTDFKKMEEKQDVMISEQKKANSLLMLLGDRVSADGKTIIKANGTIIKMI